MTRSKLVPELPTYLGRRSFLHCSAALAAGTLLPLNATAQAAPV